MGQQEIGDRRRHAMTHAHVPISHQTSIIKQKFKDKFVQNFKTITKEHQTNAGAFLQAQVILPGALDCISFVGAFPLSPRRDMT